jgi:hypothetical protein
MLTIGGTIIMDTTPMDTRPIMRSSTQRVGDRIEDLTMADTTMAIADTTTIAQAIAAVGTAYGILPPPLLSVPSSAVR